METSAGVGSNPDARPDPGPDALSIHDPGPSRKGPSRRAGRPSQPRTPRGAAGIFWPRRAFHGTLGGTGPWPGGVRIAPEAGGTLDPDPLRRSPHAHDPRSGPPEAPSAPSRGPVVHPPGRWGCVRPRRVCSRDRNRGARDTWACATRRRRGGSSPGAGSPWASRSRRSRLPTACTARRPGTSHGRR